MSREFLERRESVSLKELAERASALFGVDLPELLGGAKRAPAKRREQRHRGAILQARELIVKRAREAGYSNVAIARELGVNESFVRDLERRRRRVGSAP